MTTQAGRFTRRLVTRGLDESGVALITALLAVMLMSAMMVGMFAALSASQRADMQDRDQTQAYAAAHAGLEKLTSSMAQLFATDWSPSASQINNLLATPPVIPGFSFTAPGGTAGSGYLVTYSADANGNPVSSTADITTGPFTGFKGIITPYQVTVTAAAPGGAEVRLRREIQTVAVPVLQFGVFSDSDLTFYAGDNFSFGGRVHTNKNLFLCEFAGTMTFSDRITAFGEVVHNYFSNGLAATSYSCTGQVLIPTSASTNRNLKQSPNEGSVTGMPGPGQTANPNWTTISTGSTYYKSWIRTGLTGAKKLDLPLTSQGASPIDLIRRPAVNSNEDTANKPVFGQRYFSQASLRILLSDRTTDITGLPTSTAGAPVELAGNWLPGQAPPAGYTVGANTPPIALSRGPASVNTAANSNSPAGTIKTAAAVPAPWANPTLTVNTAPAQTVTCTGRAQSSFTGCTSATLTAIPVNTTVTASGGSLPAGYTVSTTVATAIGARANTGTTFTITTPANATQNFAANTFWIDGVPWACMGYDATPQFTGCASPQSASFPASGRTITTSALSDRDQPLIGGYIKIEKQDGSGNWSDVTAEILGLGIGASNLEGNSCGADPNPNAILRIQRLRDNGGWTCTYNQSTNPYDWWPNTLYDAREGNFRTVATTAAMNLGGVMQYIALDVGNLKKWFAGTTGTTGTQALNNNGYIVFFSDRRGDHNESDSNKETGQYGFEDQVNPTSAAGTPDSTFQTGEDVNGNAIQDLWGETPSVVAGVIPAWTGPANGNDPYSANGRPWSTIANTNAGIARVNKVVLFRRALKLINGGISGGVDNLPTAGLTVASENPVYVQGNYNATAALAEAEAHVPAAIIADAVTLLSNNWSDLRSFVSPNATTGRSALSTGYRFGVVAGKGLSFPHCGANCGSSEFLFGTDGGAGNFLRLLEDWQTPNASVNYRGSLISLFISNQATGTFKYNTNVYDFAIRNFSFDSDFLTPQLLPPGTPMFRDINTLKFRQILRPNQ